MRRERLALAKETYQSTYRKFARLAEEAGIANQIAAADLRGPGPDATGRGHRGGEAAQALTALQPNISAEEHAAARVILGQGGMS